MSGGVGRDGFDLPEASADLPLMLEDMGMPVMLLFDAKWQPRCWWWIGRRRWVRWPWCPILGIQQGLDAGAPEAFTGPLLTGLDKCCACEASAFASER